MSVVIHTSSRLTQVKEYLLEYINQNKIRDRLPSETAIAKALGVSRNTLREVYVELENEGIIIRRHGIGTFIAHSPTIRDSLNDFSPFTQIIRESGFTPNFRTLSVDCDPAPQDVCEVLMAPPSSKVCCIKRIVLADQLPVIFIEDYIAPTINTDGVDWNTFDGNMVQFLASLLNTPLHHIQSQIRASVIALNFDSIWNCRKELPYSKFDQQFFLQKINQLLIAKFALTQIFLN